jgi:hypothetical protein
MASKSYSRDYDAVKRNYFAALNLKGPRGSGGIGGGARGTATPTSGSAAAAASNSAALAPAAGSGSGSGSCHPLLVHSIRESSDDLFFGFDMDDLPSRPPATVTPSRPVPGSGSCDADDLNVAFSCPIPIKRGALFDDDDDAAVCVHSLSLSLSLSLSRTHARTLVFYRLTPLVHCVMLVQSFVPPHLLVANDDTFSVVEYRRKKHALTKL